MISFSYKEASFAGFLASFAAHVGVQAENRLLVLPQKAGKGFIRYMDLPNGLGILLIDFTLNDVLYFKREHIQSEYYVFTCETFASEPDLQYKVDGIAVSESQTQRSVMYLMSFLSDFEVYARPGTSLQSIRVLLSKEWLAKYFNLDNSDEVLVRYLALKTKSIHVKELDYESKLLMNEMLSSFAAGEKPPLFYESRLLMIMENFFNWLYTRQTTVTFDTRISREDVERVITVEKELVKDLSRAPFIDDLARASGMSSGRLKKVFKDIFGLPLYQYFQKLRMQKARELLLKSGFSVTDAGMELGYENLGNFATAFKKQFGVLPGDLQGRKPN